MTMRHKDSTVIDNKLN